MGKVMKRVVVFALCFFLVMITKANINMTDLFNYCYNYQKIHTTLGKNYGIMQKAGDSFIAMAKEMDKAGTQNVGGQGKATQDEINAANKNAQPQQGTKKGTVNDFPSIAPDSIIDANKDAKGNLNPNIQTALDNYNNAKDVPSKKQAFNALKQYLKSAKSFEPKFST